MRRPPKRLLGISKNVKPKPIFAPKHSHSLLLSAAGGGKTSRGSIVWLESMISDDSRALIVNDPKDGEQAAQTLQMCIEAGRKVAVVDGFSLLGKNNPHAISLNQFSGVISAYKKNDGSLVFAIENACHALIEEPPKDTRNQYWRDEPRTLIEFALIALLRRKVELATPGGVWSFLTDPETLIKTAKIEAEEGDTATRALALHVLGMSENEEHFPQHRAAATKALRIYAANSTLHETGVNATLTHEQLINERYVVFLVGPVKYIERLGADYALHLQSFMEALLSHDSSPVTFILDEFTNAPLQALVSQLTTMRAYGGGSNCLMIAQSISEIERKYGAHATKTILENAVIKQWFGFSSFDEAEKVSKAIGETLSVSASIGLQSGKTDISGNLGTNKERLITPEMLMSMPFDEQLIHVKDVGFIQAKKICQNEIAPSCYFLTDNPLEGAQFPPDPKITLPFYVAGKKPRGKKK